MSALHSYGLTNVLIKMQGEIPILDGSALEFCQLLEEAGVVEQAEKVEPLRIDRTYCVGNPQTDKFIQIEPADHFDLSAFNGDYSHTSIGDRQIYVPKFTGYSARKAAVIL